MKKILIILVSVVAVIGIVVYTFQDLIFPREEGSSSSQCYWVEAYDKDYHWEECNHCQTIKNKSEHILDEQGECLLCSAFSGNTEFVTYEEAGNHARVVGCVNTSQKVRILPTYNGLPVTEIASNAFKSNSIQGVVIPKCITTIGDFAFYECSALSNLILPNSITAIGKSAFEGCNGLMKVEIPDSVKTLGESAFQSCENLTDLTLSKNVERISAFAFRWCSNLPSVEIPEGVRTLGKGAFSACYELGDIKLPDTLTTIEEEAFSMCCRNLTDLEIPDSVEVIEKKAFYHCYYLVRVNMSLGIKSLSLFAFDDCENLQYNEYGNCKYLGNGNNPYAVLVQATNQMHENYEIHNATKVIADYALTSLSAFRTITLPAGLTSICANAFISCRNLTAVIIPKSVVYIGENVFDHCDNLTTIYCKAESLPSGWDASWNNLNKQVVWGF